MPAFALRASLGHGRLEESMPLQWCGRRAQAQHDILLAAMTPNLRTYCLLTVALGAANVARAQTLYSFGFYNGSSTIQVVSIDLSARALTPIVTTDAVIFGPLEFGPSGSGLPAPPAPPTLILVAIGLAGLIAVRTFNQRSERYRDKIPIETL